MDESNFSLAWSTRRHHTHKSRTPTSCRPTAGRSRDMAKQAFPPRPAQGFQTAVPGPGIFVLLVITFRASQADRLAGARQPQPRVTSFSTRRPSPRDVHGPGGRAHQPFAGKPLADCLVDWLCHYPKGRRFAPVAKAHASLRRRFLLPMSYGKYRRRSLFFLARMEGQVRLQRLHLSSCPSPHPYTLSQGMRERCGGRPA